MRMPSEMPLSHPATAPIPTLTATKKELRRSAVFIRFLLVRGFSLVDSVFCGKGVSSHFGERNVGNRAPTSSENLRPLNSEITVQPTGPGTAAMADPPTRQPFLDVRQDPLVRANTSGDVRRCLRSQRHSRSGRGARRCRARPATRAPFAITGIRPEASTHCSSGA